MYIPEDLKLNYYELILTEDCNLRCKYCFDDYFEERANKKSCGIMKLSLLDDIINFIEKTKIDDKIIISYFGGEPMMNWEFIEKSLPIFNSKFNCEFSINTNGMHFTKERINFLIKNNVNISLSLDGKKEYHDINRINKNGDGSWEEIMKYLPYLITKLKRNQKEMNILMVVNKNNYKYVYDNYKFCSIDLKSPTDILFDFLDELTDEYIETLRIQLTKIRNTIKIPPLFVYKKMQNKSNFYCWAPMAEATITSTGKLFFCHQLVPKMTEINDNFYGDIWDGYYNKNYYEIMKKSVDFSQNKLEECNVCPSNKWCAGGCSAANWWNTKSYEKKNKNQCKINNILTEIF